MAQLIHIAPTTTPDYTGLIDLAKVKEHLTIDYTDSDTLLQSLVLSAIQSIEKYCGISLVEKEYYLHVLLEGDFYELPYGPVKSVTSVARILEDETESDLALNDEYRLIGTDGAFSLIRSHYRGEHLIEYTTGYTTVDEPLKQAIYAEVAYRYQHRGDELQTKGLCMDAQVLAFPYQRVLI